MCHNVSPLFIMNILGGLGDVSYFQSTSTIILGHEIISTKG